MCCRRSEILVLTAGEKIIMVDDDVRYHRETLVPRPPGGGGGSGGQRMDVGGRMGLTGVIFARPHFFTHGSSSPRVLMVLFSFFFQELMAASDMFPGAVLLGTNHQDRYVAPREEARAFQVGCQWVCHHPSLCNFPATNSPAEVAALRRKLTLVSNYMEDTELVVRVCEEWGPECVMTLKYLSTLTKDMGCAKARQHIPLHFIMLLRAFSDF